MILVSFSLIQISTDFTNPPLSSVVNVCARGSLLRRAGGGGGGGFLTVTVTLSNVFTVPEDEYCASASERRYPEGNSFSSRELDDNLNTFVPVLIFTSGAGVALGSLMKNDPIAVPALSVINLTSETVASALEVFPLRVMPFLTNPKLLPIASCANAAISTLRTVDAELYPGRFVFSLYGLEEYVVVGLSCGPFL